MTVDDFIRRLEGIGTQIDSITDRALAVAGPLVSDIKAAAPVNTGSLRNSIGVGIEGNARAIFFTMKDYGYFQNYGVQASPDSTTARNFNQTAVEDSVRFALPPSGGQNFRFGAKIPDSKPFGAFYSGLNAVGFFSMAEIQRRLVEGLQTSIDTTVRTT